MLEVFFNLAMKKTLFILSLLVVNISCGQDVNKEVVSTQTVEQKDTVPSQEVSFLFIGDVMGHDPQIQSAYNPTTKSYNYDTVFHYMKPVFESVDFAVANLEVTLGVKPYKGYPQFSSPAELGEAMVNAGIDVIGTANNHSCDKGKKGVENTLLILDTLGVKHTGTFYDKKHKDTTTPLIVEKNGVRVAIINFTYGTNGLNPTPPNIVNYYDTTTILESIKKAKSANPDQIIAFVHWGLEYKDIQSKDQERVNKLFNDNGVNIVIGGHPHVIQPMKWEKDTLKKTESLVVYSLGNFVSNQRAHRKDGGAVFELTLKKDSTGTYIKDANYILTWVYTPVANGKKHFMVLPASQFEENKDFFAEEEDYLKMKKYIQHGRDLMGKENVNINEKKIEAF